MTRARDLLDVVALGGNDPNNNNSNTPNPPPTFEWNHPTGYVYDPNRRSRRGGGGGGGGNDGPGGGGGDGSSGKFAVLSSSDESVYDRWGHRLRTRKKHQRLKEGETITLTAFPPHCSRLLCMARKHVRGGLQALWQIHR